jgi:hypothetical protein
VTTVEAVVETVVLKTILLVAVVVIALVVVHAALLLKFLSLPSSLLPYELPVTEYPSVLVFFNIATLSLPSPTACQMRSKPSLLQFIGNTPAYPGL